MFLIWPVKCAETFQILSQGFQHNFGLDAMNHPQKSIYGDTISRQRIRGYMQLAPRLQEVNKRMSVSTTCLIQDNCTVKKAFRYSHPQTGCHLPNSPQAGKISISRNFSRLGRLVSEIPAGDGNIEKLFLRCAHLTIKLCRKETIC